MPAQSLHQEEFPTNERGVQEPLCRAKVMEAQGSEQDLNSRESVTVLKLDKNGTMDDGNVLSWRFAESARVPQPLPPPAPLNES